MSLIELLRDYHSHDEVLMELKRVAIEAMIKTASPAEIKQANAYIHKEVHRIHRLHTKIDDRLNQLKLDT